MAHLDTVEKLIASARILLQDTVEPYRYPDTQFISVLNDAVLEARRLRPDLFLSGDTTTVPVEYTAAGNAFNIELMFRTAFTYYMAGKVQLVDDETTQDTRATVFLNKFVAQLTIMPS